MTQHPLERRYKRLAVGANRKAERLNVIGRITEIDLFFVYQDSGGHCAYCGIDIDPMTCSFDHVIAFDRGGRNDRTNMKACCLTCQREKFTKDPAEFDQWKSLVMTCAVCGRQYRPRWADYQRGYGRTCSRKCSGAIGGASRS